MSLIEQINVDLKAAMFAKNEATVSVLRMLNAALKNREISLRDGAAVALDDEAVAAVIRSEVKKRGDSVAAFTAGGRPEMAAKETAEIAVLKRYLPPELAPEAVEQIVRAAAAAAVKREFGPVMGAAMAKLKGQADGKLVGELVKKVLAENA